MLIKGVCIMPANFQLKGGANKRWLVLVNCFIKSLNFLVSLFLVKNTCTQQILGYL